MPREWIATYFAAQSGAQVLEPLATLKLAEDIAQNPGALGVIRDIVGMNTIQKLRDVEPPLEPQIPPTMGEEPEVPMAPTPMVPPEQ